MTATLKYCRYYYRTRRMAGKHFSMFIPQIKLEKQTIFNRTCVLLRYKSRTILGP